jgi:hypothetical protein
MSHCRVFDWNNAEAEFGDDLYYNEQRKNPEPVFVRFTGAQELIQGIDSASLCSLTGRYVI